MLRGTYHEPRAMSRDVSTVEGLKRDFPWGETARLRTESSRKLDAGRARDRGPVIQGRDLCCSWPAMCGRQVCNAYLDREQYPSCRSAPLPVINSDTRSLAWWRTALDVR